MAVKVVATCGFCPLWLFLYFFWREKRNEKLSMLLLVLLRLLFELLMLPLQLPVAGATLRMPQKHLKMESRRLQFAVCCFAIRWFFG